MQANERSLEILNLFGKYIQDGDESTVKGISEKELEITLIQCLQDKESSQYEAMERWLDKLTNNKKENQRKNEKVEERIWNLIFLIVGVLITYISTSLIVK
ncbi:MAG: hypothetical protein P9X22_00575 [Candidatus Zapsychrus exili]|nr:hypothetical protein [Candidatus Zapsychrus exili]